VIANQPQRRTIRIPFPSFHKRKNVADFLSDTRPTLVGREMFAKKKENREIEGFADPSDCTFV